MTNLFKASLLGAITALTLVPVRAQIQLFGNTYATFTNVVGSSTITQSINSSTANPNEPGGFAVVQTNRLLSGTGTRSAVSFLGGGNFGVGVGENETFTLGNLNLFAGLTAANTSVTSFTLNIVGDFRLIGTADSSNPNLPTGLTVDSTLLGVTLASLQFTVTSSNSSPASLTYALVNHAALTNLSGAMYFGITDGYIPVTYDFGTSSFNTTLMAGNSLLMGAGSSRALGSVDLANIEFLTPIPEPGTYAIAGVFAIGLVVYLRRRRS